MQSIVFFVVVGCIKKSMSTLDDPNRHMEKEYYALFDREVIDNEIKSHRKELMDCHKTCRVKKSNGTGRITVEFIIAEDGRVYETIAKENTFESQKVTLCILNVFTEMRFPLGMQTDIQNDSVILSDGSTGIKISYPLLFESE